MTAFADAVDALFADPHLAEDATFFRRGSIDGASVRVILTHADEDAGIFRTDAIRGGLGVDVRVSEVVDRPEEGSRFEFTSGRKFSVRTARQDDLAFVWGCDVDEVS